MNITCSKELLANNISIVSKAVSTKTTLNILECILLIADEKGFRLIANDLELGIETMPIEADVLAKGSVALEAKIFSEIIRKLPNEDVNIDVNDKNVTVIKCGKSEFKILGQSGEEFPFLAQVDKIEEYKIAAADFRNMIKRTIFSVSVDESKPVMTGELLELTNDALTIAAVDGFRISVARSAAQANQNHFKVVIPSKSLNEISKILPTEEDAEIQYYFTDRHILFQTPTCIIVSRLIEGDFINFENLFTNDYTSLVTIQRDDFLTSIERASLISKEINKSPVKLQIDQGLLVITSNTEIGTAHEEIFIELDGLPITIAFNPRYLIDVLKVMTDSKISIQFTTPLSPCIIKGEESGEYHFLILPLRLKE